MTSRDNQAGLTDCKRCSGDGEVLSLSISGWVSRHPGTFSPCPDCKGAGRITIQGETK